MINHHRAAIALAGGGAAVATRPFWPAVAAWFAGLFSAPVVATVVGALLPSATGGGRQTHDIEGTDHTIQINGDMSVGEVYDANGLPTGIQVSMTDVDENGRPTGFTPLTEEDAQALGALTGTDISAGSVLETMLHNDNTDGANQNDRA